MQRPWAITVLSWLFILLGVISLGMDARFLAGHGWSHDEGWILVVHGLAILGGAFMLRGANWARWLILLWSAFHVGITILNAWHGFAFHAILFTGIAILLFRADARAWFGPRAGAAA